ncbi:HNH endonuclease [Clostridium tyrobutyricum]|uniref:HNH endonuclease n=1 Tax=Clostridium tyrobutyricum TaxID=1519 RepID=UPI0020CCE5C0|nr:HNH endonuclease [Clostridium tyrobutyricum]
MLVPKLEPVKRNREYNNYGELQKDKVVYYYLFISGMSNRKMDKQILKLNPGKSNGYQSMGILHYIGLKKQHKGIFIDYSISQAINVLMQQDKMHFAIVIDSLKRYRKRIKSYMAADSWELMENKIAIKTIDYYIFTHRGGFIVNEELKSFFGISKIGKNYKKDIFLIYRNVSYSATLQNCDKYTQQSKITWDYNFESLLKSKMPCDYSMLMVDGDFNKIKFPQIKFIKLNENKFKVEFIYITEIEEDIKAEIDTYSDEFKIGNIDFIKEGKVKYVYSKQYERDCDSRIAAIKYHGTKCVICGFDFEKAYGERGKGYIEIHHIRPLSYTGKEIYVNPKTDLVPVCANCHRMIHRRRDKILTIEEMQEIINKYK